MTDKFVPYCCVILVLVWYTGATAWDYFVYTQQWPLSACIVANSSHHTCVIPNTVTTWTIHGLWPNKIGSHEQPSNCNKSWPFDAKAIQPLLRDLEIFWPNLFTDEPLMSFWTHEWQKHGTCCTDLPATADEFHYFSIGLLLNKKYNLTQLLSDADHTPGTSFNLSDFNSLVKQKYGASPKVQCAITETAQLIYQVELCLDKSFSVIVCPDGTSSPSQPDDDNQVRDATHSKSPFAGYCSKSRDIVYPKLHPHDETRKFVVIN